MNHKPNGKDPFIRSRAFGGRPMMKRLVITLALFTFVTPSLAAEDCAPKRMAWLDAKLTTSGALVIPAAIEKHPTFLSLDTGADVGLLSKAFAKSVGFSVGHPSVYHMAVINDPAGSTWLETVTVRSMQVGEIKSTKRTKFIVSDSFGDSEVSGALGANFLGAYDVDLDMAQMKVGLYSQTHCEGNAVHWAENYAVIPFQIREGMSAVKVLIEGHPFDAIIDTGSTYSILDADAAKRVFGLVPGSPGMEEASPVSVASGARLRTFHHKFATLALQGVVFTNVPMRITKSYGPEVTLGMHELRFMHAYVAYSEQKLYVTSISSEVAARDPVAVRDLVDRGMRLASKGNVAGALAAFDQASGIDPTEDAPYVARGSLKAAQGDHEGSIAEYTRAIALAPDRASTYILRSRVYITQSNYALAAADATKAIDLEPKNANHFALRGAFHFFAGAFLDAAEDFEEAVKLEQWNLYNAIWLHLARIKTGESDRFEFARNVRRWNLKLWPLPVVELFLGKMTADEVRAELAKADQRLPQRARCEASFYIGEYELAAKNVDAARSSLREAVATCGHDAIEYRGAQAELAHLGP